MEVCNFEIAKKLKEKGFKDLCFSYYTNTNDLYFNYSHKAGAKYSDCYFSHNLMPKDSVSGKFVDAPTISQVLKWLREEKHLHIHIEYIFSEDTLWICEVQILGSYERFYPDGDFNSYEEAAIAGIKYVLDNLI